MKYKSCAAFARALGRDRGNLIRDIKQRSGGNLPPWYPKRGEGWDSDEILPQLHALGIVSREEVERWAESDQEAPEPAVDAGDRQRHLARKAKLAADMLEIERAQLVGALIPRDRVLEEVRAMGRGLVLLGQRMAAVGEGLTRLSPEDRAYVQEQIAAHLESFRAGVEDRTERIRDLAREQPAKRRR